MKIKKIDNNNINHAKTSFDLFFELSTVQSNSLYLYFGILDNQILGISMLEEAVMVRHIKHYM